MINFEDKENTKVNNLPRKNTWTALDMNEIKTVVNALAFTRVNVSGAGIVPDLNIGQLGLNTTDGILYLLTPSGMMNLYLWLYNFWVFADWADLGVTNQATFIAWIEANSDYTVDLVTDFSLVGFELKCNISASGGTLIDLSTKGITEVKAIGNGFEDIADLNLNNNDLLEFNPVLPLPDGLNVLSLSNTSLTEFNPILPLPNSLKFLYLNGNNLTEFNPDLPLPSSLQILDLINNDISDWSLSLPWINSQPTFDDPCAIFTETNPSSAIGTTFETVANTKNAIIVEQ
jgi:hypothetical protein